VLLTLPIREAFAATPRARIIRVDLGSESFPFRAGQAAMLATHGYEPRRPYSIAAGPEDATETRSLEFLVGVEDDGRPGPHLDTDPGTLVDVEGPIGNFTFPDNPAERRFVFIAGGTGIAPLRAMVHHALRVPHAEVGLLYSARTPDDFAYADQFRALAAGGQIEFRQKVTRRDTGGWLGGRGRIDRADLAPLVHNPATLCFVCGPPSLVDEIPRLLGELGVSRERIRLEEWG
jgi:ferredoxin-NADP reductase